MHNSHSLANVMWVAHRGIADRRHLERAASMAVAKLVSLTHVITVRGGRILQKSSAA